MPCLFLRNVPPGKKFDPAACRALYDAVASAAGTTANHVEVHIESAQYHLLGVDGVLRRPGEHGVHCFVEWYGGRSPLAKQQIATAIQRLLIFHDLGRGSDITFRDSPPGTFFFEGKLVPGGV